MTAPISPYAPSTKVSASAVSSHRNPTYRMMPAANSNDPNTARRRSFQDGPSGGCVGMELYVQLLKVALYPHYPVR
jgi:hypothetical protein